MKQPHPPQQAPDLERILTTHGDTLYRLCLVILKNQADAEDAIQETLLACHQKAPAFADENHEKAWLITVASNKARDILRTRCRRPQTSLEVLADLPAPAEDTGLWEALLSLPDKFRGVLVLHYVEGYKVKEVAQMLRLTPSAVKMRLQKGRKLLEDAMERSEHDG